MHRPAVAERDGRAVRAVREERPPCRGTAALRSAGNDGTLREEAGALEGPPPAARPGKSAPQVQPLAVRGAVGNDAQPSRHLVLQDAVVVLASGKTPWRGRLRAARRHLLPGRGPGESRERVPDRVPERPPEQ